MATRTLKTSLCLLLFVGSAYAAPLWMRRSEMSIAVDDGECIARAFRAFRAEGFTPVQNLRNGVWGSKGERWTLIVCNAAPANAMWVNIVSASAQTEADAHYRDHEKVGARMSEPSSAPVATAAAGCGWRDGQDSAGPDSGRGVTNWDAHFRHVNEGPGVDSVHTFVGSRLAALGQCVSRESYAATYASVSLLIAAAGRQHAGWIDGMDSNGGDDPGRGVSNRAAHFQHVASGAGASSAHTAVANRMASLRRVLPREAYARLYADVSVVIARCGVSGTCG